MAAGGVALVALPVSRLYVALPGPGLALAVSLAVFLGGLGTYLAQRPAAYRLIWPVRP